MKCRIFTYLVLIISIALDFLMYYRVPDVTICYRCLSQFRGKGSNPPGRFKPFDLGDWRAIPAGANAGRADSGISVVRCKSEPWTNRVLGSMTI